MIVQYSDHQLAWLDDILSMPACSSNKKIGIINWWWLSSKEAQIKRIENFVKEQDICFFLIEEIFDSPRNSIDINSVFKMLNQYNVFYILFSDDYSLTVNPDPTRTLRLPWFFKASLSLPSNFNPDLDYRDKEYDFNLLLGSKKSYRTLLYKSLKDNKNVYLSYLGHPIYKSLSKTSLDDADIVEELIGQNINSAKLNTAKRVKRENSTQYISHVVPSNIYANTHFDIVSETKPYRNIQFITEKTAKPLATGRYFCWFGSPNLKAYLHEFGFDLSDYEFEGFKYDDIISGFTRMDKLVSMIDYITSNKGHVKLIYSLTKHARIHNMEVYNQHRSNFRNTMVEWVSSKIKE